MGLQTKRFNTGAGVVFAALGGLMVWAGTCAAIYASVTP
jgi:hypothetical protein